MSLLYICQGNCDLIILDDAECRETVLNYIYRAQIGYHLLTPTAILMRNQPYLERNIRNMTLMAAEKQFVSVTNWLIIPNCSEHFCFVKKFMDGKRKQFALLRQTTSDELICHTTSK